MWGLPNLLSVSTKPSWSHCLVKEVSLLKPRNLITWGRLTSKLMTYLFKTLKAFRDQHLLFWLLKTKKLLTECLNIKKLLNMMSNSLNSELCLEKKLSTMLLRSQLISYGKTDLSLNWQEQSDRFLSSLLLASYFSCRSLWSSSFKRLILILLQSTLKQIAQESTTTTVIV
jgi:hypothetical protein